VIFEVYSGCQVKWANDNQDDDSDNDDFRYPQQKSRKAEALQILALRKLGLFGVVGVSLEKLTNGIREEFLINSYVILLFI
jgi:hypothetical protein